MPSYRVTTPRFHHGTMYGPGTSRDVLTVEVPFKPDADGKLPNGLILIDETVPQAEKPAPKSKKATAPQPDAATIAAEKSEPESL